MKSLSSLIKNEYYMGDYVPLFNQKTIQKFSEKITISNVQKKGVKEWLSLLEQDKLKDEVSNHMNFKDIILEMVLGYDRKDIFYETKNKDFQISNNENKKTLCFELKGTKTKDLLARQIRSNKQHSTPVKQTWDYIGSLPEIEMGVCTNYRDFILITKKEGYTKIHKFDFLEILEEEKFKEFLGIFSKNSLITEGFIEKLHNDSIIEEQDFTNEFYKLYHETRLMIKTAFQKNEKISSSQALYFTQIFLDRLIFMFFVADKGYIEDNRLFANRILQILNADICTENSKKIYDEISELFIAFDSGNDDLGIFGFNGELFSSKFPDSVFFQDFENKEIFKSVLQHSTFSKTVHLNTVTSVIMKKYENKLNPIIKNLLILDSFDFKSEINVNILGRIFEQSISDLEELDQNNSLQRKKEGVYYTPPGLTKFICKTSIIGYLSENNSHSIEELIEEFFDNIEKLERKFVDLKILDPACGSGAFLIESIDVLMEIGESIYQIKKIQNKFTTKKDNTLDVWNKEDYLRIIIENNIFGVDINRSSVGITKLSIFLKLASYKRKLIGLSKNIQQGNSLIDDSDIDHNAFDWNDRFPDIFWNEKISLLKIPHENGFDVIVGNPPWQIVKPDIDEFFSPLCDGSEKFSKLTKNKKNNFMKKCLNDPITNQKWQDYQDKYKKQMNYFNNSSQYVRQQAIIDGKKQSSDLNLYKLFVEKIQKILKRNGVCGLIIPSGIYSDLGTQGLRKHLLFENNITDIFSFVNKGIFVDVHKQFQFCILIFKKSKTTKNFRANFVLTDIRELMDEKNYFQYNLDLIHLTSPDALLITECKNKKELEIFQKMYEHPLLGKNTWNFVAKSEFHMTNNSNLFHTSKIGFPLYEGKMINMYEHKFAEPRYWIEEEDGISKLRQKESRRAKLNSDQQARIDSEEFRLVWRTITNATNERGLISTILPPNVFLGNSLNYLEPIIFKENQYVRSISYRETFFLCGFFNSFSVDFIIRHKISSNLNIFYLKELPIPRIDENNKLHKQIVKNTSK